MAAGFLATLLPSIIGGVSNLAGDCNRKCGFRHPFNKFRRQDCREACDITATKEAQAAASIEQYSNVPYAPPQQAGFLQSNKKLLTYTAAGLAVYYIIKKIK